MKAWFLLIVRHRLRTYGLLLLVLAVAALMMKMVMTQANEAVQVPIAVQNLDRGELAENYVAQLRNTDHMQIVDIEAEEVFLERYVTQQRAVAVVVIPKDYSTRVASGNTKALLSVYAANTVASDIALELLSRTLYEQQLPPLVTKHLGYAHQAEPLDDVWAYYRGVSIDTQLTQKTWTTATTSSLSLSVILAVALLLSTVQLFTNRVLTHQPALVRAGHPLSFFIVYSVAHAVILTLGIVCMSMIVELALTAGAILKAFVLFLVFESIIAALLYYVQTRSHQLFFAILVAVVLAVLQLGGVR
jgi:ABC-2 type transport system permease protein